MCSRKLNNISMTMLITISGTYMWVYVNIYSKHPTYM